MSRSSTHEEESTADEPQFSPADYVLVLPNQLNDFNETTPAAFNLMCVVVRNLLAAKLKVSWFTSTDKRRIFIRVSAGHDRLVQEAERTELQMRKQFVFREAYDADNETFEAFKPKEIHNYYNCFIQHGTFRFSSLERQRLVLSIMTAENAENGANIHEYAEHISEMFPMHDTDEVEVLAKLFVGRSSWLCDAPIREIRDYWGEELALYYAFLSFHTKFLFVLAIGGVAVAADQFTSGYDSLATTLCAVGTQLCAVLILEFWIRTENTLKSQWNVEDFEETEVARPGFRGQWGINPVSGVEEFVDWRFSTSLKRIGVMLLGFALTVVGTAVCLMPTIGRSYVLDSLGYYGVGIAAAVTHIVVLLVNAIIKRAALWATNVENHRTQTEFMDSLILKAFVLQFMPTYGALLWTAFVQEHVTFQGHLISCGNHDCYGSLAVMLSVQFTLFLLTDNVVELWYLQPAGSSLCAPFTACRQGCARLVPRVRRWWMGEERHSAELDRLIVEDAVYVDTVEERATKQPVYPGPLSEYQELFWQYGYVVLFAPAFPLVALLACINNVIRVRMDGHKLCRVFRRPLYTCAEDIGSWAQVLKCLSVMSVLTNAAIIAYTCTSLQQEHVYGLFGSSANEHHLARLAFCLVCEHVVFFIRFVVAEAISDQTDHVLEERKRRSWEKAQEEAAHLKSFNDGNMAYVIRQRVNEAPDRYEHHVDDI